MNETTDRYQVTVKDLRFITPDVMELTLQFAETFLFQPGQYVWLILPNFSPVGAGGGRRAFSIASGTNLQNEIVLIIRNNPQSGYKKALSSLSSDDQVFVEGPFGKSYTITRDTTFITEGVSVAPFLSLLRSVADKELPCTIHLISLHHATDHLLYESEFRAIAAHNHRFVYQTALVGQEEPLLTSLVRKDPSHEWYILGSAATVESAHRTLIWNGVLAENIHFGEHYPRNPQDIYLTNEELHSENGSRYFKYIVEQSANHIIITDLDGNILYANKAAEHLTGYSFEEMRGQTPRLWGGLMGDDFYVQFWKTIKEDKLPFRGEITNRKKNGVIYRAVATVTPIFDDTNKLVAFVGIEEDITEHLNIERDLQKKTTEIEKLNKLMIGRELKMVELKKELRKLTELHHE